MRAPLTNATRLLLCVGLMVPELAAAAGFEGTVKSRTISVAVERLATLIGEQAARDPQKVFAIPMDQLLAQKDTAGSGVEVREVTISVKGSKVRADGVGRERDGYVVMDADGRSARMVMPGKKQYVEWTTADVQALGEKMSAAQKAMQERIAEMPPQQRRQMEAMMQRLPGAQTGEPKPQARPLGKTLTINGMRTTAYEVREGAETTTGWVTRDQPELLRTFKALRDNEEKMMPSVAGGARAALAEHGLPVRVQTLDQRQYRIEEIVEVQRQPVAAELFAVPDGFEKTTPQHMMGGAPPAARPK